MNALRITLLLVFAYPFVVLAQSSNAGGIPKQIQLLTEQVQLMSAELSSLRDLLDDTQAELAALKGNTVLGLDGFVSLTADPTGLPTVLLSGANLQVVNGAGMTESGNGVGNVLLGYNASSSPSLNRQGSHNLVLGDDSAYPSAGELRAGRLVADRSFELLVAGQMEVDVGSSLHTRVASESRETVAGNKIETVGGSQNVTVSGNRDSTVGGTESIGIGGSANQTVGHSLLVEAGDLLILKSGSATTVLDKSGDIDLDGKDILIKGSGDIEVAATGPLTLKGSSIVQN